LINGLFQSSATRVFIAALLGLLSALGVQAQGEDDVVKVDSSIVVMNATIRDAQNRSVNGLKQGEFKVFEDGVQQKISSFESQESPFSAVILLDTSGSMEERISIARSAAINFLNGLRVDDYAAIYRFDSQTVMVQDFSDSRDITDKIFDLKAKGQTVLNDAVVKAVTELDKRSEKRKAVIVISDGADTFSKASADKALKSALAANVTIYTVDMSSLETNMVQRRQSQGVLKSFAEKTGGVFISTENVRALRDALKAIVDELQIQYTIAYEPTNLKRDGKWHALELRVARPNLAIRTREGYNAPKEKR